MVAITIGVTVNLANYENIRVEARGTDDESHQVVRDAVDVALADLQARAGNPAIADAIARYRVGVLGRSGLQTPESADPAPVPPAREEPKPTRDPAPAARAEPAPVSLAQVSPLPERMPPASTPAVATPGEEPCTKCGVPVSKSQAKLSNLFMNKTLCKACMEAP